MEKNIWHVGENNENLQDDGPRLQRLIGNVTVIMANGSKCHAIWMKTQMSLYWHCLFVATSMRTCISTL